MKEIVSNCLLLAIFLIGITGSILNYRKMDTQIYDNTLRVQLSEKLPLLAEGQYEQLEYPYLVTDLSGYVCYTSGEFQVEKGEQIPVNDLIQNGRELVENHLKTDYKICFALEQNGRPVGYAAFWVPQSKIGELSEPEKIQKIFLPVFFAVLLDGILMIGRSIYSKRRIFNPISEISESANAIIKGDYDKEVVRVYGTQLRANEVGNLIYSFELMRDELKEKRISEQKLKEAQQELISCISHDLRTPLATIKAYCEGIRDGIAKTEAQKEEYVAVILKKTNFLVGMIKELLEYSNAQMNRLAMYYEEVYMRDFFIPLCRELQVYALQKNVELTYNVPEEDFIVRIDQKRITEVLYNLVENSMKYMESQEGTISIELSKQGKELLISVKDNGCGISSEDIMYVFDKFYRSEKSRSSKIPGSGLGLSICKYIIEQHGGRIYCNSAPGAGTEIGFTLLLM